MLKLAFVGAPRIFIIAFALVISGSSLAQFTANPNSKILLDAKFMERDNEKDITILRDNVQVIMEQNYISCNEAVIQWSRNQIVAVGNVLLKTPKATIQADKIVYDMKEQKGQIYNGVVVSGKILMQGEYLEKIGPDTYKGENAYLTSCSTCPASWSFTADKFEATIEGYAHISSSWLHFSEVPAIYLPYLIIPLKNERQTGLLPPNFELNQLSGFSIDFPFFWAINRSSDLTYTPKYYTKRGFQSLVNYRYRLSEKSGGELNSGYLADKVTEQNRWYTNYNHFFDLPNGYAQRTSVHLASDNEYSRDFQQQFNFRGESALDNRVSLSKNFPGYHLSIDSSYYLSLIQKDVDDAKQSSVHRVPEIRFNITDKKVFDNYPLYFRFDSQYINYARQGLGFDSPTTIPVPGGGSIAGYQPSSPTGIFDPAVDKVRTGQRLDLQPYFYAPLRILNNTVDVTPFVSYRHTQYVLGALNEAQDFNFFPHRSYTLTGINTSTELSRVFETKNTRFRHSIIPEVSFQTIQGFSQTNHTFFGVQEQIPYFLQTQPLQDLDLAPGGRGLQFDYEDRIIGRRLLNLSLSNKIVTRSNNSIGSNYKQAVLFRVSQAYDMIEAKKDQGQPWQDIRGLLNVRLGKLTSITEVSHFPYHKVTNLTSGVRMYVLNNNYFDLSYSNYINVPARPVDVVYNNRRENMLVSAGVTSQYSNLIIQGEYDLKDSIFQRWSVIGQIIPPGRCWVIETNVFKTLDTDNIGGKFNVTFLFGN